MGHLPSQPAPDPGALWGGGLRPLGERAWVEVRDGVVGGVKRFTWLVVPVEAGKVRIEPIVYTYFDPYVGAFGQVSTDELVPEVDPYPPGPGQASLPAVPGSGGPGSSGPALRPAAPDEVGEGPPPSPRSNDPMPSPRTSSPMEVPGAGTKAVLRSPGAPELDARMLELRLEASPANPKIWLDLGTAYAVARPGEGWAEWAWLAGLRNQPRNPVLREAVWGGPGWRVHPGLPLLPLSSRESLYLGALLLGCAAVLGLGVIVPLRGAVAHGRHKLLGLSAAMVLAGALALAPWMALRAAGTAVAVGGPAALHSFPSETSEVLGELNPGTPVRLRERFGAWMRIEASGGAGWAEAARLAELPSVPAGM